MNLPEEYAEIAKKLIDLTNNDDVKWSKGKKDNEFILDHNKIEIGLYPLNDPDQEKHFYFFIFKSQKAANNLKVSDWDYGYEILEELYNAASRNAQDIRGAIKDFLSEFD